MARYWVSGASVLQGGSTATDMRTLLGVTITSGRTLWLTSIFLPTVTLAESTTHIYICDSVTGLDLGAAASASEVKRLSFLPLMATVGVPRDQMIELPMPGMKFSTGCVWRTSGSHIFAVGTIGGAGYEV